MSDPPKCFTLEGLGSDLERDEEVRTRALAIGGLLKWPTPQLAGTITMHTLADNASVVLHVLKKWVPQLTEKLKTVNIHTVEPEARQTGYKFKIAQSSACAQLSITNRIAQRAR